MDIIHTPDNSISKYISSAAARLLALFRLNNPLFFQSFGKFYQAFRPVFGKAENFMGVKNMSLMVYPYPNSPTWTSSFG